MSPTEIIELNIACTLIGFLIGNYLTIGRDRRRELNDLINPVRDVIFSKGMPGDIALLKIRERLPYWKRGGFDRAIEAYKQSKGAENRQPDGGGGFHIIDKALIVHAANDLLKYLKPK